VKPREEIRITLRSAINRLTFLIFAVVGLAATIGIFVTARIKQKVRIQSTVNSMFQSAKTQTDLLIPTFILPEQMAGAQLLLKKITEDDSLERASILSFPEDVPPSLSSCHLEASPTFCVSLDGKRIATINVIREEDQVFGYLLKVRNTDTILGSDQSIQFVGLLATILTLTLLVLLWGVSRITARDVPASLTELAT